MQSNFIGTEFQIFDDGERTTKHSAATSMLRQTSFFGGKRHFLSGSAGEASVPLDPEKSPLFASLQRAGTDSAGTASSALPDAGEESLGKGNGPAVCRGELGVVQYHMNVMGTKGPRKMVIGVPYVDLDTNTAVKWNNGESMINKCAFALDLWLRTCVKHRPVGLYRSGLCLARAGLRVRFALVLGCRQSHSPSNRHYRNFVWLAFHCTSCAWLTDGAPFLQTEKFLGHRHDPLG